MFEHGCPEFIPQSRQQETLKTFFGPIRMVMQFIKNEWVTTGFEVIDTAVSGLVNLTDIFRRNYVASMFCKGFLLG